jgi:methionyl-tRNA formyltransferase
VSSPLRLVFAGTPEFALPALQCLLDGPDQLLAVYTQPDRPAGRGRASQASPVKQLAVAHGIEVRQPETLKDPAAREQLRALRPDLLIVVAYGLILSQKVLDIPRLGCWNLHASLLPRWRGAAPIQRAIEAGDDETGICLMQMQRGLDTGPVLLRRSLPIRPDDSAGSLHDRLADLGGQVLADGLARVRIGDVPGAEAQSEDGVVYAHKLEKAEARLDFAEPADLLARRVRAFSPWPVAEAVIDGERLRIHAAEALPADAGDRAEPGSVIDFHRDGIDIACGQGVLRLTRVQRDGGRAMSAAEYLNARRGAAR